MARWAEMERREELELPDDRFDGEAQDHDEQDIEIHSIEEFLRDRRALLERKEKGEVLFEEKSWASAETCRKV